MTSYDESKSGEQVSRGHSDDPRIKQECIYDSADKAYGALKTGKTASNKVGNEAEESYSKNI